MATNHGHSSGGGSSTAAARSAPQLWRGAKYSIYLPSYHWMQTVNKICEKERRSVRWREKKIRSECDGTYLDRTYRHGGNEAFYTSWLWSKQWCFDCIVRALFEVQAHLFAEEWRCCSLFCAFEKSLGGVFLSLWVTRASFESQSTSVKPCTSCITMIMNKEKDRRGYLFFYIEMLVMNSWFWVLMEPENSFFSL